ncbi:MAG: OmpP1/FadL family transporter [Gammaproteobacteria bacterium]
MSRLSGKRQARNLALLTLLAASDVYAGGGYFALGYGPIARQMGGATTALVGDAFAGASNPAKWRAAGNRVDIGAEFFMPYRRIERTGSGTVYDFATTSAHDVFIIPEGAYSRQLSDRTAVGITVYGNGGLNTEYRGDNGVPGSNAAPAACGGKPANFVLGCDKFGVDIMQLVVAPGGAVEVLPGHTLGIAPLLVLQRFEAYGLQAFAPFSKQPSDLTNRGWDWALGAGARVGWLGEISDRLTLGAAYATRVYMDEFDHYEGLLADGALDIPANYSLGFALRVTPTLTTTFDYHRIEFGDVPATGNGVLNTLLNPGDNPLGSSSGSGFNWQNQDNFRTGVAFAWSSHLVLRAGYAYGARPQRDSGLNSVTLNMLTPTAEHQLSAGFSWQPNAAHELHVAYSHFFAPDYGGPSATALLGVGGREKISAHVNTVMIAWSWRL